MYGRHQVKLHKQPQLHCRCRCNDYSTKSVRSYYSLRALTLYFHQPCGVIPKTYYGPCLFYWWYMWSRAKGKGNTYFCFNAAFRRILVLFPCFGTLFHSMGEPCHSHFSIFVLSQCFAGLLRSRLQSIYSHKALVTTGLVMTCGFSCLTWMYLSLYSAAFMPCNDWSAVIQLLKYYWVLMLWAYSHYQVGRFLPWMSCFPTLMLMHASSDFTDSACFVAQLQMLCCFKPLSRSMEFSNYCSTKHRTSNINADAAILLQFYTYFWLDIVTVYIPTQKILFTMKPYFFFFKVVMESCLSTSFLIFQHVICCHLYFRPAFTFMYYRPFAVFVLPYFLC